MRRISRESLTVVQLRRKSIETRWSMVGFLSGFNRFILGRALFPPFSMRQDR